VPIVAPEGEPCVVPEPGGAGLFAASGGRMGEYTPAAFIDLAAKPIPLLAAEHDGIIPIAQVREAFARAQEPKALEVYPRGHFELYPGRPFHEAAAERAAGWFGRWL
jgi:fermentation-respiration switch protein FrsA (DUF1100 family)